MPARPRIPIALTIAGSDSGGGAGVQADLKAFAMLGVHGTSVITCLTAQNPRRILAIEPVSASMVRHQLEAVCSELPPAAAKTGVLYSSPVMRTVAGWLKRARPIPLVVDPVMLATTGRRLVAPDAQRDLIERLLPLATLVTPNVDEAQVLVGAPLQTLGDLKAAAIEIHRRFGCAALVKGGHLRAAKSAVDVFWDGRRLIELEAPWVRGIATHGTGCTYSAAITAELAKGLELPAAVRRAKRFVAAAIQRSRRIGKHTVLLFASGRD